MALSLRRLPKALLLLAVLAAVIAAVYLRGPWRPGAAGRQAPAWRLAPVTRGEVVRKVSAIGTLGAVVTVDVGSQVSGQIQSLFADFNSEVEQGQLIARIDPATIEARVRQAQADLAAARANLSVSRANVEEVRAVLSEARRDLGRNRALRERATVSAADLDRAESAADQAAARLLSARAQVEAAQAAVQQREAALNAAQVDLEHTYIRSPVDGTVINRNVNEGQTVAASLQAPVLFTIAQDLRRMQLEVNVDEADIGAVREGQEVHFTVDAYPERGFDGEVQQVRKAPHEVQNVVTYTVIVSADNPSLDLLPGMTANVDIVIERRENVLRVPNAALRFRPAAATAPPARGGPAARVWKPGRGAQPQPVDVVTGITDGNVSELRSGDLAAGESLITGIEEPGGEIPAARPRPVF